MSSHTPGPWKVCGDLRSVCSLQGPEWNARRSRNICRMQDARLTKETQEANARLIAAAPDLLEALKNILDCKRCVICDEAKSEVLKAINKAGGEV